MRGAPYSSSTEEKVAWPPDPANCQIQRGAPSPLSAVSFPLCLGGSYLIRSNKVLTNLRVLYIHAVKMARFRTGTRKPTEGAFEVLRAYLQRPPTRHDTCRKARIT